jgi:hypothetical protein
VLSNLRKSGTPTIELPQVMPRSTK